MADSGKQVHSVAEHATVLSILDYKDRISSEMSYWKKKSPCTSLIPKQGELQSNFSDLYGLKGSSSEER